MKKPIAIVLVLLLLAGGIAAVAAGGSASDPLVSLGYLEKTYLPDLEEQIDGKVGEMGEEAYAGAAERLELESQLLQSQAGGAGYADTFQEQRLKKGDVLTLGEGSSVLLLAGGASFSFEGGAVVDATTGAEVASGAALEANHRYLSAEDTLCGVVVTSDTAVLAPQGYYAIAPSDEVDYNELADALREMNVFRGSSTGYGSSYELELPATRIQGLIMFLRLMGEEEDALAYTGEVPFTDVPDWCRSYVAYAADKGYVGGYGDGRFGTDNPLRAREYLTMLLRALGYTDGGAAPDFTFDTVISRARELGVITAGEESLLNELNSGTFLRAHLAYFSYYALTEPVKGSSETLLTRLGRTGAVDAQEITGIMAGVSTERIE